MEPHYRHTQIGWVIVLSALVPLAVLTPLFSLVAHPSVGLLVAAIFAAIVPLFGWMTVTVSSEALRVRLGVGLIYKTVLLASIRSWSSVRNSAWMGWGIHFIPGGTIWNVSGFDAVELVLDSGRRLRVGTDEPQALVKALAEVLGEPRPLSDEVRRWTPIPKHRIFALLGSFTAGLVLIVGGLIVVQSRPPRVHIETGTLQIESLFYGQEYRLADVTSVELLRRLPRIRLRTNGFSASGVLRGHFRLDGLGDGKLFLNVRVPPYVLLRLESDYVIVNFPDPKETQALYDALVRAGVPDATSGALRSSAGA